MKIKSETLITELTTLTKQNLKFVELLKQRTDEELIVRKSAESWNTLECLEHLNLYGTFYIREIEKALLNATFKNELDFKSGFLGNYFAESMLPKDKINKIKTFKDKNPINSKLDRSVIDKFINQQTKIIDLLDKSRNTNLGKVRVNITLTKWIKLKLGDTFRFVINHNIRHIKQIENILKST
jgi:hypothetical protein